MSASSLKEIKIHNLYLLVPYLLIRYKVYIGEFRRKFIGEFRLRDFKAKHYVFVKHRQIIGISRIICKENVAELGRVAILKEHRKQGNGSKLIEHIINYIKANTQTNTISLYAEDERLILFYKQFGFVEKEEVYFNNTPYMNMQKFID